jgi:hypothetical protein
MVYICHGNLRQRLVLDCSRFYSKDEIFRIARDKHKQLFLEYGSNIYLQITCDVELRFASAMVEKYVASFQSDEDLQEHLRGMADMAHTERVEAKMRRKPKTNAVGIPYIEKNRRIESVEPGLSDKAHCKEVIAVHTHPAV